MKRISGLFLTLAFLTLIVAAISQAQQAPSTTNVVCNTITPAATTYTAAYVVGTLQEFKGAFRANVNSGLVQSVAVSSTAAVGTGYDLCIFSDKPTASTIGDKALIVVPAADLGKWRGCVPVSTANSLAATEVYWADNLAKPIYSTSTSLWGVLRTTGTPTYGAAATVTVCVSVLAD